MIPHREGDNVSGGSKRHADTREQEKCTTKPPSRYRSTLPEQFHPPDPELNQPCRTIPPSPDRKGSSWNTAE